MRKYLIGLCFISGLVACGRQQLQKQIEEFTSKEIVVPDELRQIVDGRDSVVLNPAIGAVRLVVYVDSTSCSSCRLNKMFVYSDIIGFCEEIGNKLVPLFIFSPPITKTREVLQILEISQFTFPVFIDERQVFPASNPHIPADNRFHTFLLDKNGKVVLVGDPVNNPALWDLYKTTITTLIENGGTMPPETEALQK